MARVLVLGAGFGGIAAAVALREQLPESDEVLLVDRRDDFAMGLRKTWAILGISPIAYGTRSLAGLAARGINVIRGTIERVDPSNHSAIVDGTVVEADALVVALGAEPRMDLIPGLAEHAHNAWDRGHLDRVHAAVDAFHGGRVVVGIFGVPYPCPPAPYELALLLSERFDARGIDARLSVFAPVPIVLPILGAATCATLDQRLEERGITFQPSRVATAVTDRAVQFGPGEEIPFDLLLAVPPHRCPSVLVEAGLAPAGGWVTVNRATLETDHPGVYAIGDATVIPLANGMPLPKAGLFAEKEGEAVAARIAASLRGDAPTATFDGRGACFLEMGNGEASTISGDFFADPPATELSAPSGDLRASKERFEMDRLARWFGT
ncbi:MAG: NAD(P)/FAD-dependent oxidoreductase [Chloroflexota bacterium]|nr:NAD(P)/FAD-dependent oxidoreductase [Chloroflexota bacterium]